MYAGPAQVTYANDEGHSCVINAAKMLAANMPPIRIGERRNFRPAPPAKGLPHGYVHGLFNSTAALNFILPPLRH